MGSKKHIPRCCCGCMHLETAAMLIAVMELAACCMELLHATMIISNWDYIEESKWNETHIIVQSIMTKPFQYAVSGLYGGAIGLIFLLILGVHIKTAWLLIPHILLQIITILGLSALTGFMIYGIIEFQSSTEYRQNYVVDDIPLAALVIYGVCAGLSVLLEIHFVVVIIRCYLWLKKSNIPLPPQAGEGVQIISAFPPFGAQSYAIGEYQGTVTVRENRPLPMYSEGDDYGQDLQRQYDDPISLHSIDLNGDTWDNQIRNSGGGGGNLYADINGERKVHFT